MPNSYNMFIRVKKVKKRSGKVYEYAHLVRGVWRKKRIKREEGKIRFRKFNNSIHKYSQFLGKVYRSDEKSKEVDFKRYFNEEQVKILEIEEIYRNLIEYELLCRGFVNQRGVLIKDQNCVDLKRLIVHDGKGDIVIKLKDMGGYLCALNLEGLFKIKKISNKYEGMELLKRFKSLGIQLEPDQFFILADRLLKEE